MLSNAKFLLPLVIVVIATIVRLVNIDQSFWLDEAAQALESSRSFSEQINIKGDFQPPLYHFVVWGFERFSRQEEWLRLASIIPAVATIYLTYLLGTSLYSQKVGAFAGILGALSAYHYYYSQELRPYALATFWVTLSMWYFFKQITTKSNHIQWGYVVSLTASLYSMYLTPFLLLTQLVVSFFLYRTRFKQVALQVALASLFFLPWLPTFWQQLGVGMSLKTEYVGWSQAVSLPLLKSLPLTFVRFLIGTIRVDANTLQVGLFAVLAIVFLIAVIRVTQTSKDKVVVAWATMPILLAFLVSWAIPVLEPKRVLFCLPAIWLLLGRVSQYVLTTKTRCILGLLVYTLPLFIHFFSPTLQREEWRQAISYVEKYAQEKNSVVVFAFSGEFAPYTWYQTHNNATISIGSLVVDKTKLDDRLKQVHLYERVFTFDYLMDLSDRDRDVYAWLKQAGYREVATKDFHGVGFVRTFDRQMPVALLP